jgi:lysozyme
LPIRRLLRQVPAPTSVCCAAALLLITTPLLQGPTGSAAAQDSALPRAAVYAITPRRQALLNTIRYAEGTWKQGSREGYHTLYGGGRFASLARHPEIVVVKRYRSAAAGAYQFLPGTWKEASSQLKLDSFHPANQDQAALFLVERRGVLAAVDREGLTPQVMAVLAREWASFPTLNGTSAYGQPVKTAGELQRFYEASLRSSLRGEPRVAGSWGQTTQDRPG